MKDTEINGHRIFNKYIQYVQRNKATKRTKGKKNHQKLPHRFEKEIREPLKMKIYSN